MLMSGLTFNVTFGGRLRYLHGNEFEKDIVTTCQGSPTHSLFNCAHTGSVNAIYARRQSIFHDDDVRRTAFVEPIN